MASMKQARYVREKNPDAKATIFYIDLRTLGRNEEFYYEMLEDTNITYTKGKVAKIEEDPETKNLILDVEDTVTPASVSQVQQAIDTVTKTPVDEAEARRWLSLRGPPLPPPWPSQSDSPPPRGNSCRAGPHRHRGRAERHDGRFGDADRSWSAIYDWFGEIRRKNGARDIYGADGP